MFEGGCECGAVRYRMNAKPIFVNCCHCRDCQKITGSAFAINALIEADQIDVSKGVENVSTVEGATRCNRCNSLLWAEHRKFSGIKFLRVGTLDEAESVLPDAHFFIRSKHHWVKIPQGVPMFETLPPEGHPSLLTPEAAARLDSARR